MVVCQVSAWMTLCDRDRLQENHSPLPEARWRSGGMVAQAVYLDRQNCS